MPEVRTVQLRRYEVHEPLMDAFVAWWCEHMPVIRPPAGFEVEFAYIDREASQFVWAVGVAGDAIEFARRDAAYYASDARSRAMASYPEGAVRTMHVSLVESVA